MEKGKRENSASFCFLRMGFHFSQCLRGLPRPPQQGSEDTGKGARLSWWQEEMLGFPRSARQGCWDNGNHGHVPQAVKPLWLGGRQGTTIPHSRSFEGQEL